MSHHTDHIAQAVRKSHCSHDKRDDKDHHCIGECTITPQGIKLDCKACGSDVQLIAPSDLNPGTQLIKKVLDALGIDYQCLSPEYKARAAEVAEAWYKAKRGY